MKKRPQLKNNWFDCLINYDPKPTKKERVIKKLKKKKKEKTLVCSKHAQPRIVINQSVMKRSLENQQKDLQNHWKAT